MACALARRPLKQHWRLQDGVGTPMGPTSVDDPEFSFALARGTGPETTRELFAWPAGLAATLFGGASCADGDGGDGFLGCGGPLDLAAVDRQRLSHLQAHLSSRIVVYSDYSGFDCPREALSVKQAARAPQDGRVHDRLLGLCGELRACLA